LVIKRSVKRKLESNGIIIYREIGIKS
jgi:hypothetical protein